VQRSAVRLVRWRYVLLAGWALLWLIVSHDTRPHGLGDWLLFEYGARTLSHTARYTAGLGLYAHYPAIQIGPPALALLALFQWAPPHVVELAFAVAMALAGVWCLRCAERTARSAQASGDGPMLATGVTVAGVVALPPWAWAVGRQEHLDDVLAIVAAMTAMAVIAGSRRWWWLAGGLVGLAVASKPWAIVIAPCFLGLPRADRSKATISALVVAALCWGPFVLGDTHTVSALGGFQFTVKLDSALHTLGLGLGLAPRWVRPVQFLGGFGFAALVVRRGRWLAVPLAGFAFRIISDPQTWLYYGMGPVMGAVLWDLAGHRRWPVWTAVTATVEFAVPLWLPAWAGTARIVWFAVIAVALLRPPHPAGSRHVGGNEAAPRREFVSAST
jgi:Glycosyltransferase family 87